MSRGGGEHVEIIGAPPHAVLGVILDFETQPQWQSAVRECRVLERSPDGRPALVETVIDAKLRRVRYVLRYHVEGTRRVWWDYVEGDVKAIDGEYLLQDLGDGTTSTTYRLAIDAGVFVPGPVKRLLTETTMKTSVRELKARVEAVHA